MTATTEAPANTGKEIALDNSPRGLIKQYETDFATVLPSHINPEQWVRVAQAALKKGKKAKGDKLGRFELEVAAANNPAAFLSALLDAARQGLEPGSEQYYLTPRMTGGRLEILGMRGYQGEIEMMYRAGAVSSVTVEVVRKNDTFKYRPGPGNVPDHEVDWFGEDRGELIGVYAYAQMKDGSVSKVVVMNKGDIARIMSFAQGTNSEYSPWKTSTESMWLKSAAHQLRKWVPTSAEYLTTMARAAGTAAGAARVEVERQRSGGPLRIETEGGANPNVNGDQIIEGEVVPDGEVDQVTGEFTATPITPPVAPGAGSITSAARRRGRAGGETADPYGDVPLPDEPPQSFFDDINNGL